MAGHAFRRVGLVGLEVVIPFGMEIHSHPPPTDVYSECIHRLADILASSASRRSKLASIRPICEFLDSYRDAAVDEFADSVPSGQTAQQSFPNTNATLYGNASYGVDTTYAPAEYGVAPPPAEGKSEAANGYYDRDFLAEVEQIVKENAPNIEKLGHVKRLVRESRSRWTVLQPSDLENPIADEHEDLSGTSSFNSPLHWNTRWQDACSLHATAGELKYDVIRTLAADFAASAERYGKIIISEIGIPTDKKTIKPVGVGGTAGGEKFLVNGIFFKCARYHRFSYCFSILYFLLSHRRFALDFVGLYGGDRFAMKAAKHELKV